MDKIYMSHSDKDRICCVGFPNKQVFFYQAINSQERKYLFETKFSYSVYAYFQKKGRRLPDGGFYLTVADLYRFHDYHNVKLTHILERFPAWIDYLLKEDRTLARTTPAAFRSAAKARSDERVA